MDLCNILEEDETGAKDKATDDFPVELNFAEDELDLFLRTFHILSEGEFEKFSHSQDSLYRISYRIFRIIRCAHKCSLQGYYDVSMALLRIAYENHLLMNYLSKRENEAKKWFEGKTYPVSFLKENVSYANHSLYRKLCEFIHSSFKSTLWFTEIREERRKAVIGEYDKRRFREVVTLLLMTSTTTLILLSLAFASELTANEEWNHRFRATVPKIWKYLGKTKGG